jgi:hypothetical protein
MNTYRVHFHWVASGTHEHAVIVAKSFRDVTDTLNTLHGSAKIEIEGIELSNDGVILSRETQVELRSMCDTAAAPQVEERKLRAFKVWFNREHEWCGVPHIVIAPTSVDAMAAATAIGAPHNRRVTRITELAGSVAVAL